MYNDINIYNSKALDIIEKRLKKAFISITSISFYYDIDDVVIDIYNTENLNFEFINKINKIMQDWINDYKEIILKFVELIH